MTVCPKFRVHLEVLLGVLVMLLEVISDFIKRI